MQEPAAGRVRYAILIAGLVLLAGCTDTSPTEPATTSPEEPAPGETGSNSVEVPVWEPGTWWTWEASGRDFDAIQLTTVVAGTTPTEAFIGSPDRAESLLAQILHVPPQGPIAMPTMSWYIHGNDVALIDFPLEDGKTWTGSLEGDALEFTATAESRGGSVVYVVESTYTEFGGQGPRYVWDPAMDMFSEIHLHYGGEVPFSSARVIDYGAAHEGEIAVPWAQDKLLTGHGGTSADVPRAVFTAPMEKEWLVMACYLGGSTGSYGITFVTPSPNEDPMRCSLQNSQSGFEGDQQWMWRSAVPGEWNVLFDVIGDGYATAEVIGVFEDRCVLGDGSSEQPPCESLA